MFNFWDLLNGLVLNIIDYTCVFVQLLGHKGNMKSICGLNRLY